MPYSVAGLRFAVIPETDPATEDRSWERKMVGLIARDGTGHQDFDPSSGGKATAGIQFVEPIAAKPMGMEELRAEDQSSGGSERPERKSGGLKRQEARRRKAQA